MTVESRCIDAIKEAAEILGHSPSRPEYKELEMSPSTGTIYRHLGGWNKAKKQAGVSTVGTGGSLSVNTDYFKTIDNTEQSYWLGFIYGDGCVSGSGGESKFSIGLMKEDREHVEKLKNAIESDHKIYTSSGIARFQIGVREFVKSLISQGVTQDKTFGDQLPNLSNEKQEAAFIRGLFDADGHIGENNRFNITSSSQLRLGLLEEWLPVDGSVQDRGDGTYTLRVGHKDRLNVLYDWLYPKGKKTCPSLKRKKKTVPITK